MIRVQWRKARRLWYVTIGEYVLGARTVKAAAVRKAITCGRVQWEGFGVLTQVMIHKRNGEFQTEYTYGEDPRRSKG